MQKQIELAPMLDWTDTFFRQFFRLISHHMPLYTEMVAEQALAHGSIEKLLSFNPIEQPLVLQVGGSTPDLMANAAHLAEQKGFKAININAGCPSERVQAGSFGACLMSEPQKVVECVKAMKAQTQIPVTIKTRIALDTPNDSTDGFEACCHFIETTANAGCNRFIIHARKARLKGMTPKENRKKLPINYELVYRIKEKFPELEILINGQILSILEIQEHLKYTDGVMIGRWAYANPYDFIEFDKLFYNDNHPILSRKQIIQHLFPLIEKHEKPLHVTRHLMGLYAKTPFSKKWKQILLENDLTKFEDFMKSSTDLP
ncbi:MAG: tRNA dihydrouridine(20/20a) synthase DusA [Alphaproteobacteria bacterium]|nr:tRNA dihydrouridine(20/20a) synthase DusA [Alphaproteobacteria bacterium]